MEQEKPGEVRIYPSGEVSELKEQNSADMVYIDVGANVDMVEVDDGPWVFARIVAQEEFFVQTDAGHIVVA